MDTITVAEAESKLSELIERAAAGEEIVIAKDGQPRVRLVPIARRAAHRPFGLLAGQVRIGDDFDDPLPEDIMSAFRGDSD
jgi:prevent-host-death family protein